MNEAKSWFSFVSLSKPSLPLSFQSKLNPVRHIPLLSSTPGSPGVATPTWDVEKDTNGLFCEHGIEEIKQIEQQTRLDIDRRREDLRQMVGERYRDLIDAADSIVDMQKCSEQVDLSVKAMEVLCQRLQQTHFLKGSGGMRGPPVKNESHEIAAQLKLLADCPEKVWVCLEAREYLKAAQHYLLARHIYSHQIGLRTGESRLTVSTKVVQKLWQSVSSFKEIILECCNRHLQCLDLEEGPMLQSLCAVILLEGCSPRQAFTQFLLARKAAIQSTVSSGSGMHKSVKTQICHLVKTILHSLLHIAAIFCQHQTPVGKNEPSLLLQQLLQFSYKDSLTRKEGSHSNLIPEDMFPLLPSSVVGFSPTLRSTMLTEIPPSDIHHSTEDWITMCASDVLCVIEQLLQHVTSIKALNSIKSAIHSLLATPPSGEVSGSTPWADQWSHICYLILNRELNIWDTFFRPVLLQRVKLLLDKQFSGAGSHASIQLTTLLTSITENPARYYADTHCHTHLWREEGRKQNCVKQSDGMIDLTLKSKSCTPSVYVFCQSLGGKLDVLIEDVSHYMQSPHPTSTAPVLSPYSLRVDQFPFLLYSDTADIQDYIQESTLQWITGFLQNVDVHVTRLQQLISSDDEGQTSHLIDRLLVLGRLCQCLLDCCQSLSYLIAGGKTAGAKTSLTNRILRAYGPLLDHPRSKEVDGNIKSAITMLYQRANSIFRIWGEWSASQFTRNLSSQLSSDFHYSSLASSLVWSELTISEEAESGKKVSSIIHVPSQASTYITSLLFTLSREISRVGGHTLDRDVLQHLSEAVLVGIVKVHEDIIKDLKDGGIPQPCALQLYYNIKFVSNILTTPKENEQEVTKRIKSLLEGLLCHVDPFDLNVFMPYILANLESQLNKSSVMLGMLLAIRGSPISSSLYRPQHLKSAASGTGQDRHMVLPLAQSVGRIPFLPLSSKPAQPQVHKVEMDPVDSSLLQTLSFFYHL